MSLGTHEQPFPRLLDLVGPLTEDHELVIQHGHTPARIAIRARWIEFAGYDDVVDLMGSAEVIVCHAGVGTILTALALDRTPMVVPRLRRLGEHVDDHQLDIVEKFASLGYVVPCTPGDALAARIAEAKNGSAADRRSSGDLRVAVANAARVQERPRRFVSFASARRSGELP